MISRGAAGELFPVLRTDDLAGAIWIPGDGKANPADLTMSLAKGARKRGVKIVEDAEVTGVLDASDGRASRGVRVRTTAQGDIACEIARQLRRPVGAPVRRASPASTCRSSRPSTSTSSPTASRACTRCCR